MVVIGGGRVWGWRIYVKVGRRVDGRVVSWLVVGVRVGWESTCVTPYPHD